MKTEEPKDVSLPSLEEVMVDPNRPTITLFTMAKNAEAVLPRLLENVGPYVDELVLVANDCSDGTADVANQWTCDNAKPSRIIRVTHDSYPEIYILDVPGTYQEGEPLVGEDPFLEHTGRPILADWSRARNTGWDACTTDWRLFMDADDVLLDPWNVPRLVSMLDKSGADLALCEYQYAFDSRGKPSAKCSRERLAYNSPAIRWQYPIHECLTKTSRVASVEGSVIAKDMKDNVGAGTRSHGRNFKVLYHHCRSVGWNAADPHLLAHLVMEAKELVVPCPSVTPDGLAPTRDAPGWKDAASFAKAAALLVSTISNWNEQRAWALAMAGEAQEKIGDLTGALVLYEDATVLHRSPKTWYRMARARYSAGDYRGCVEASYSGDDAMGIPQLLDGGAQSMKDATRILLADSLVRIGRRSEALAHAEEALAAYPASKRVKEFVKRLRRGRAR